jgi:pimeloyl-ACP methyl ester carboxylesterase
VIWGRRDPYVPVAHAEGQRDAFPDARIVILEDSGHWPYADNPQAVLDEILPFLKKQVTH